MSNPFATFRKNQNYWMAALVLLAILAFVVAPAIQQVQEALRGGGAGSAVVVRWNGGKMTVADLQNNMQKHGALVRFLNSLAREVISAGGQPKVPGFFYDAQSKQIYGLGISDDSSEESICRTRILADKAKRLGVEFSDDAIDEFILAYCDGRIPTKRLAAILQEASDGRLSNFDVRELLKQELAAMVVRRTASTGFYASVPGETFQDFMKLNRTAKVEAFPVFVADHVSKVNGMPTETEIKAIYDLGSGMIANPNSPDPGFVQPYQANIEYVESNFNAFVNREKEKITEEQIRAEYDRLVGLEQLQVPVEPPTTNESTPQAPPADGAELPAVEPPSGEAAASSSEPSIATPTPEAPSSENTPAPASGLPATDGPALESTPTELPIAPEPAAANPGTKDQSSLAISKVRFVSTQQDGDDLPPTVVQPPQPTDATATAASATDQTASPSEAPAAPAMRTKTFEEAREQIADSLARAAAIPKLDEVLTNLREKVMLPYFGAYRQYAAFRDAELEGKKVDEPQRPNFKKQVEDAGLTYGQTGITDGFKLVQTQFGTSSIQGDELGLTGTVANMAMTPQLPLFQPMQSSYFDAAVFQTGRTPDFFQYLFWKTEERPMTVPELADVRGEVVDFWKRTQARQLAEATASAMAKKVNTASEAPWKDALSTAEQSLVIETDPFTWISRMGDYNITTNVNKLDAVGGEFMQGVFSANSGQCIVVPNQNKSVYYVVRIVNFSPEKEELQQRFSADPDKRGALEIAQEESNQRIQDWYENLYNELGVQFEIPLNQL